MLAAFDPGESTGMVKCELTCLTGDLWQPAIQVDTILWPEGAADIRDTTLDADIVIVEDFRVRDKEAKSIIGDRLWSAEVTGWIVGTLTALPSSRELVMQAPLCKDFCSPHMVCKRLSFWPTFDKKGKAIASHEGDALLHLLYYLSK